MGVCGADDGGVGTETGCYGCSRNFQCTATGLRRQRFGSGSLEGTEGDGGEIGTDDRAR